MSTTEILDFKPSKVVNIARELNEIIENTKKFIRHPEISQTEWNNFILAQNITVSLHENLCITQYKKIPWEWRQDDNSYRISIFIHYVREDRINVTETCIKSPKLFGEFWSPVTDISIHFDNETSSTIVEMTPKEKIRFPVLIRCGLSSSEHSNDDQNYIIYNEKKNENDPEMDTHSMFFLGMLAMLYSKPYFYDWMSIAACQDEPNAMSYLARVCLGDKLISEAAYWFSRLTLDFGFKPSTLDLSIILINNGIKPQLAENLLCGLCKDGVSNGYVELGKLYLYGCKEKRKEVIFENNENNDNNTHENIDDNAENNNNGDINNNNNTDNLENSNDVPKNVEKGIKLLNFAVVKSQSEEAASELKKYNKEHPFGQYSLADLAISTGVVATVTVGAFWLLKKFITSRKK